MRLKHILCYVNQIKAKKYEKRVDFIRVYVVNYFSMKRGGNKNGKRNFNETAFRSRCSLWTPNKKMEP